MLLSLPSEYLGVHVLSMLSIGELVMLDSASLSHGARHNLHDSFSRILCVDLSTSEDHYICDDPSVWTWFWKRQAPISNISPNRCHVNRLSGGIHLVRAPVRICFKENTESGECTLLSSTEAAEMITEIVIFDTADAAEAVVLLPRLQGVRSISADSQNIGIDLAVAVLKVSTHLQELSLHTVISAGLIDRIVALAPTLHQLAMRCDILAEPHCSRIAHHCRHLTGLTLSNGWTDDETDLDSIWLGMWSLAQGCTELRDVTLNLYVTELPGEYLLPFATHCPKLQQLSSYNKALFSNSVAAALLSNSTSLKKLECVWAVTSEDTVNQAGLLLSKLKYCALHYSSDIPSAYEPQASASLPVRVSDTASDAEIDSYNSEQPAVTSAELSPGDVGSEADGGENASEAEGSGSIDIQVAFRKDTEHTLNIALGYLHDVTELTLDSFQDVTAVSLNRIALHCTWLTFLALVKCPLPAAAETAEALITLFQRNPGLITLRLTNNDWLTDPVVEAVASCCPRMREMKFQRADYCSGLHCDTPSFVTDGALAKLAAVCKDLRTLAGLSGPYITDAGVQYLAQHCPHLRYVDLAHCELFEDTLVRLVQCCRELRHVQVCGFLFDDAAAERLQLSRSAGEDTQGSSGGSVRVEPTTMYTEDLHLMECFTSRMKRVIAQNTAT
jgi:hypothetical protein